MSVSRTTRWKNEKENNYEKNIDSLMDYKSIKEQNEGKKSYYQNFKVNKLFENTKEIELANENTKFDFFEVEYEKVREGTDPIEERTDKMRFELLVYNNKGTTKYIINRSSEAMYFIRKLLKYKGQREISDLKVKVDSDFFLWLIYKIYKEDNIFKVTYGKDENDIALTNIKFLKGISIDNNNVTSQGNTVLNLISTLSFVLEKGKIKQLVLCVSYGEHENIEIRLETNGAIGIGDIKEYDGIFEKDEINLRQSKVLLLIYNEILPMITDYYNTDIKDKKWDSKTKVAFLQEIKEEITDRIEQMKNTL
ncbi:hypothetical protein FNL10_05190 [Staphylococcus hominis]|uniref:hypothetical protein n=1 Tax=Staphylococcus hominis TaxID=1290 RepID=UPI001160B4B8|nr:hypothetical protein [Staphylococcus hominis]TRM03377.1 hypothetical protein FNL10_05190 [Staphylococcus hominis]